MSSGHGLKGKRGWVCPGRSSSMWLCGSPLTILVMTSARSACGSTPMSLQVSIKEATVAQCAAPPFGGDGAAKDQIGHRMFLRHDEVGCRHTVRRCRNPRRTRLSHLAPACRKPQLPVVFVPKVRR